MVIGDPPLATLNIGLNGTRNRTPAASIRGSEPLTPIIYSVF